MNRAILATIVAFLLFAALPLGAQQAVAPLPPGEGREIVAVACTQCHAARVFTQIRQGAAGWRNQVSEMIQLGAQVRPSEMDAAVKYLTTNFGMGVRLEPSTPVVLPAGTGRELVQTRCSLCHGVDRVAAAKRTPVEWRAIVARMIALGAPLTPAESKDVTAYVSSTYRAGL